MKRLDIERQKNLEPKRLSFAKKEIEKLGYVVKQMGNTKLQFEYKGSPIYFFPYSGWHSGKTIIDGRGLDNLLKQIK
ncbi:MAG: hypothetical protein PHF86_01455 [Candidatus Nanoarchaeia archaeon]|nr:hypothetical protein [Candidatus Nanoarchaeia archaeon]